jgi:hypothetical protein
MNQQTENQLEMTNQQVQMGQQQQQQMQPPDGSGGAQPPQNEDQQKMEEVRQAMLTVDQMKRKKGHRSMQDEAKYKAAVQIVAKNRDLLPQMGLPQSAAQ